MIQYYYFKADFLNLALSGTASVVPETYMENLYMHIILACETRFGHADTEPKW